MNTAEERQAVEQIKMLKALGVKLTDREQNILAYSPYGTGQGCSSCASGPTVKLNEGG